jgi:hypothetical protein
MTLRLIALCICVGAASGVLMLPPPDGIHADVFGLARVLDVVLTIAVIGGLVLLIDLAGRYALQTFHEARFDTQRLERVRVGDHERRPLDAR